MPSVAEHYLSLSQASVQISDDLPAGTIAERYHSLLTDKYTQINQHRSTFADLFAGGLRETDGDFERISGASDPMHSAIHQVVTHASDALTADINDAFVNVLYVFYLLLVLFRLYDRTPQHQASEQLLNFVREVIKLLRPMMFVPMFVNATRRLSAISVLMFSGVNTQQGSK